MTELLKYYNKLSATSTVKGERGVGGRKLDDFFHSELVKHTCVWSKDPRVVGSRQQEFNYLRAYRDSYLLVHRIHVHLMKALGRTNFKPDDADFVFESLVVRDMENKVAALVVVCINKEYMFSRTDADFYISNRVPIYVVQMESMMVENLAWKIHRQGVRSDRIQMWYPKRIHMFELL